MKLDAKNNDIEIILVENKEYKLALNTKSEIDMKIEETLNKNPKQILFFCGAKNLSYTDGKMTAGRFEIVGFDLTEKKEVWKAKYSALYKPNPKQCAKKSAEAIVKQIKIDKIL